MEAIPACSPFGCHKGSTCKLQIIVKPIQVKQHFICSIAILQSTDRPQYAQTKQIQQIYHPLQSSS